jgi:hypothetical protein
MLYVGDVRSMVLLIERAVPLRENRRTRNTEYAVLILCLQSISLQPGGYTSGIGLLLSYFTLSLRNYCSGTG